MKNENNNNSNVELYKVTAGRHLKKCIKVFEINMREGATQFKNWYSC